MRKIIEASRRETAAILIKRLRAQLDAQRAFAEEQFKVDSEIISRMKAQLADLAEAEAETKRNREWTRAAEKSVLAFGEYNDKLKAQLAEERAVLTKYGNHQVQCEYVEMNFNGRCTCGFTAALPKGPKP